MAERPLSGQAATRARTDYIVRPLSDREEIRQMLVPQRVYAAYALGQLQAPLFARSEWWVARGADGQALVLHSHGGLGEALFALGTNDALEALLRLRPGPRYTFLTCEERHLETALRHFRLPDRQSMSRMLVNRSTFKAVDGEVRRLTGRDIRNINRLYRADGTPAYYSAENIDDAAYHGIYRDGRLVAVAGTHVVARQERIAVVGNVFTHPSHRNEGLGAQVTSAVTKHLLATCQEVVLSVDPRNAAAVRAYERLGYRVVGRLIEGAATRRGAPAMTWLRRQIAAQRGRHYGAELVSV